MTQRSIRRRFLAWTLASILAALLLAGWGVSIMLADFVQRRLQAELQAVALGIMAAADWDEDRDALVVDPHPADPRFGIPQSGWYWQLSDAQRVWAHSDSLLSVEPGLTDRPERGPDGAPLLVWQQTFVAPGNDRPLTVTVTLPMSEVHAELASITRPLVAVLVMLGLMLLAAATWAVHAGLVDLRRLTEAVAQLRQGTRHRLAPDRVAAELRPLVEELNRLQQINQDQIAHARAHAGDLAHALKTPLAVLANRARPDDRALIERMDRVVRWHLQRARAAVFAHDPQARCAVGPALDDLALVLQAEAHRLGKALQVQCLQALEFRGDCEDLAEMVGNLAENALKWARRQVRIEVYARDGQLCIDISDDGPGVPSEDRRHLLARGLRLDRTMPGHGMGLAIVADRAALYGGTLQLLDAVQGGLLARLQLPMAEGAPYTQPPRLSPSLVGVRHADLAEQADRR